MKAAMKKFSFFLCFWFISIIAFPQWHWQNPLPCGNGLTSVWFTDTHTGYAVGSTGTLMQTNDGGVNWSVRCLSPYYDLYSICFTNDSTGYIAGYAGGGIIFKTTDAGTTWDTAHFGPEGKSLNSIFFVNENTGYAVGSSGTVLKTTDAGMTWTTSSINYFYTLNSVFFTDVNTGYAVGSANGVIFKTTDGGETWSQVSTGLSGSLNSVFFTAGDTGYVCGSYGALLKTVDAGVNWVVD
ncbi:MAG: YCF48-related protein, partial [Bacteroidota bacterium]